MKKIIKKIFFVLMLIVMVLNVFSCAMISDNANDEKDDTNKKNGQLKKGIYCITNPFSRSNIVFNEKGEIIIRGDNITTGNYVIVINDKQNESPICISKLIMGERKITNTYEYEGQEESYSIPSQDLQLYDLEGKVLPFKRNNVSYIDFGLGEYIYYNNYGDGKKFAYNVKTNEEKELDCDFFACDRGMIFLSDYAYEKKAAVRKVSVYNKNLELLKTFEGYTYEYEGEYKGKKYIRLATYSESKDEFKYNYLDDNLNLLLDEPIVDDARNKNSDGISNEEYQKLEKTFNEIDPINSYVQIKKYNGITLYLVGYGYEDETTGEYMYGIRIYDKDFKLYNDGINSVQQCFDDMGLILVNNDTFIDFNFNVIKKFDRKSEWQSEKKNGKTYFFDIYAENYESREDGNLYDDKFNVLLSNVKKVSINMIPDYIVIEDAEGTKLYDNNLKLCKDYGRHLEIYGWGDMNSNYHSFHDNDTNLDGVMDEKWNIIIDNLKSVGDMRKDYFTFQKGFRYGLMDYKENVLIDFSIFDSTSDEDRQGMDYMY